MTKRKKVTDKLSYHPRNQKEEEQMKHKASKQKTKIRSEVNKIFFKVREKNQ